MGLNDNIKKNTQAQKEFNAAAQSGVAVSATLTEEARNLGQELKDQLGVRQRINDFDKALLSISNQITAASQENKEALGDTGNITKQILKENKAIDDVTRERLISEKTIGATQKAQALALNQLNQSRLTTLSEMDFLRNEIATATGDELAVLKQSLNERNNNLATLEGEISLATEGLDKDTQRLALIYGMGDAAQNNLEVSEREAELQAKIQNSLGISGKLLGAVAKNFGGFGKAIGIDQVAKDMEKAATEAVRKGEALSRSKTAAIGAASAAKNLMKNLSDPTVILGSLLKGFQEVDKAAVDFQRTTGQDGNTFALQIDAANNGFITMTDYLKTATALTKELGMNATNIFSAEDLQEASRIEHYMGMTAKEASQLAQFSKINGKSLEANNEALIAGVNSFNAQNKTGVLAKGVLEDIANVSADIGILYVGYPEKLGAAGTAAAAMGNTLAGVKKIASSLLDFESSIAAEMEAELLTGKQLNLEKARQLALNNDLEGVSKELMNQGITAASFAGMNAIAQQAQAKALGMSTEEMSKMLIRQGLSTDMSEEGLNAAQKQTLEQMKQEEAAKKMEAAMAKISQALAPLVDILADIITPLAGFLSNTKVLVPLLAAIGVSKIGGVAKHFTAMKDSIGGALKNLKGLGSGIKDMVTGGGAGKLKDSLGFGGKAGAGLDKVTKGTKGVKPGMGKMIQNFLTGIGRGLSALGKAVMGPQLAGIAAGMGILTLSLMGIGAALGFAAPGIKAFGTVITAIFGGVATIITAVAEGFVLLMNNMTMEKLGPMFLLGPALFGIAGGLAAIAVAGLGALPIIGALGALGLVATPLAALAGIFGVGEGGGDDGEDPIIKKLDELIDIISKGGDVIMDGNKVGRTLTLASSQIG